MKRCSKCGIEKDESEFYKNSKMKDGLQSKCKECSHKYYQINKDHIAEIKKKHRSIYKKEYTSQKKEYRAGIGSNYRGICHEYNEKHKEDLQKRNLEDYYLNRNHYAQLKKEYYLQNKDSILQYHKEYYELNREQILKRLKEKRDSKNKLNIGEESSCRQ